MPNKPNLNNGMARPKKNTPAADMTTAYRTQSSIEDKVKMTMWIPREWRRTLRLMAAESDNATMSSLIIDALEQAYGTPDSQQN